MLNVGDTYIIKRKNESEVNVCSKVWAVGRGWVHELVD